MSPAETPPRAAILAALKFPQQLVPGVLVRREKRFLAWVRLDGGQEVVAHCTNTGRMTGCSSPGSRVWLSPADRPERKLKWTWELVEAAPGVLLCVNTMLPNAIVAEAVREGTIPELAGYETARREVRYGQEGSRVDLLLESPDRARCWVEVKNVTLVRGRTACFPDAVTARGAKHLRELTRAVQSGDRAALVFAVLRSDAEALAPADDIDPVYGEELRRAARAGVEILPWRGRVTPQEIVLEESLPVLLASS